MQLTMHIRTGVISATVGEVSGSITEILGMYNGLLAFCSSNLQEIIDSEVEYLIGSRIEDYFAELGDDVDVEVREFASNNVASSPKLSYEVDVFYSNLYVDERDIRERLKSCGTSDVYGVSIFRDIELNLDWELAIESIL